MLFIQTRSYWQNHRFFPSRIIQQHYATKSAAIDSPINWDFIYAEWCGMEIKSEDLSGH